jgi:hypothetical protein
VKKALLLLLGIALVLAVTPCYATTITFANFLNPDGSQDVSLLYSNLTNTLVIGSAPVTFQYHNLDHLPVDLQGDQAATLTLTATTNWTVNAGGQQGGYTGTFSITRNTPFNGHTNLLSGTFSLAELDGMFGGGMALFGDALPPNPVVFTSDFLSFSAVPSQAFALSMSSVNPPLTVNRQSYFNPATASEGGTFSADIVPEPLTFLLVGSGLVGLGLLRRRRK